MSGPVIEVRGLQVRYGAVEAVQGVDLTVGVGEVVALLGPNGAGKTSIVEVLEGYRHRSGGSVRVLGEDPGRAGTAYRARIGVVLQECAVDPYLTVREALTQRCGYYPAPRPVGEVLELVGLSGQAATRVKRLSGGQQRRLDLGLALAGDPELLFLDEPTTGFDPGARRAAWEVVTGLAGLGKAILLTTHYMDEARALADRVAVVSGGRIVAEGPPAELGGPGGYRIRFRLPPGAPATLPEALPGAEVGPDGSVRLQVGAPTAALHRLTAWAMDAGVELEDLSVARPDLEEVYLRLTAPDPVAAP